jgi:proteasome lid subunit RPN8/RPN11
MVPVMISPADMLLPCAMSLEVTREVIEAVYAAARTAHPREACGLLLGLAGRITIARQTANVHPTPATHFEIDPQALIDAHRAQREGGLKLLGYFHSHPTGDPHPSATDRTLAAGDGKVWAIAVEDGITFWKDRPDGFAALSYEVIGR